MKLSATKVEKAKPKDKQYKLFDGEGLFLLVKPNGKKHWRLKYRFDNKERLLAIGPYPLMSLHEARQAKIDAKKLIFQGVDPVQHKKDQRDSGKTFEEVAREWHSLNNESWTPRYAGEVLSRMESDVFSDIGYRPVKSLSRKQVLACVRKIEDRGALEIAKRQLQKINQILNYATTLEYIDHNPAVDLKDVLQPVKSSHFASIDVKELPGFLRDLENFKERFHPTTYNIIKVMLLTFVRTDELTKAQWPEFGLGRGLWTIPGKRMKMKKDHLVPLSRQVVEILKGQDDSWPHVFPSPIKPKQPVSNNIILASLKKMGYRGRMTGHGFRSLAMSAIKQELGYRHEVIDRQLAHEPSKKQDKAYDRALFLDERIKMMQDWADYLDSLQ